MSTVSTLKPADLRVGSGAGGGDAGGGGGSATSPTIRNSGPPPDAWTVRTSFVQTQTQELYKIVGNAISANKVPVENTAKTLFEYVEVERPIVGFRLTRSYTDLSYLSEIYDYTGRTNSDVFLGLQPRTVVCRGASASKRTDSDGSGNVQAWWEVQWEFEYDKEGHDYKLQSLGYQELKNGKKVNILDDEGDPIAEKANLDANGKKTDGFPAVLTYADYKPVAMASKFGSVS